MALNTAMRCFARPSTSTTCAIWSAGFDRTSKTETATGSPRSLILLLPGFLLDLSSWHELADRALGDAHRLCDGSGLNAGRQQLQNKESLDCVELLGNGIRRFGHRVIPLSSAWGHPSGTH